MSDQSMQQGQDPDKPELTEGGEVRNEPAPAQTAEVPAEKAEAPAAAVQDQEEEQEPMGFLDHFRELRSRLFRIFIGIIAGFAVCYAFDDYLVDFLYAPLLEALPKGEVPAKVIYTGLAEAFFVRMKLAAVAGVFLICPYIFYQIWAFIAPGLYDEEKKFIIPVAVCSALFFILGGAFCYYIVFPNAFPFFMSYSEGAFQATPKMDEYFGFTLKLIFAFGLIFELPLFTFFLARMGILTAEIMRKGRGYFIVIAFILGAVLTPPDVISQLFMAAPMLVLYEVSIFIAKAFGRKRPAQTEEKEAESA